MQQPSVHVLDLELSKMSDVFLRSGPVRVQASFCGDAGGLAHLFCDLQRCFPQRRTIGDDRAGSKRELKRILLPIEVEHNLTSCHGGINLRKFFSVIIGWNCMNNVYCLGARGGSTESKVPRCLDLDTVCARGRSRLPKSRKRKASRVVPVPFASWRWPSTRSGTPTSKPS